MIYAYIGTFAGSDKSEGVLVYSFDPVSGALEHRQTVDVPDPSYLAISPRRRTLYAASRSPSADGQAGGAVVAYSIDRETGQLSRLNQVEIPPQPAYLRLDRSENFALFACTFGGAIGVVPIRPDGSVAEPSAIVWHEGTSLAKQGHTLSNLRRTPFPGGSPFPHSIQADPENRFVLVPELGLNRVMVYRFDAERGSLTPNQPPWGEGAPLGDHRMTPDKAHWAAPRGAGPRHLDFHPNGRVVYVVNEIGSTISVFDYDPAAGTLIRGQEITTLPDDFRSFSITADIHVHPSGRFLYASNRGHDSLAIFAIEGDGRRLRPIGFQSTGGKHPRNFTFTPDERLLLVANLHSHTIVAYTVDAATGRLTPNGTVNSVPSPSCITFWVD